MTPSSTKIEAMDRAALTRETWGYTFAARETANQAGCLNLDCGAHPGERVAYESVFKVARGKIRVTWGAVT
jgi:hypothetical protein